VQLINFSEIKTSCANCGLHEICLPRGLASEDMLALEQLVKRTHALNKGTLLFQAGEAFSSLYAVRSGSIKLYTVDESGDEQIIGFYLAGELLGLDGIETHIHKCSAMALETSSICSFPCTDLSSICRRVPALQEQLFHLIGREISDENRLLLTIAKKTAEQRIATFLLSLSTRFKRLGYSEHEFRLTMSRKDIGNYLGLNIETVSRTFSSLQKMNLIDNDRKFVKIFDINRLRSLCTGDPQPATGGRNTAAYKIP